MPALFVVNYRAGRMPALHLERARPRSSARKNLLPDKPDRARQSVVANHHISLDAFIRPIHIHR